MAAQLNALYEKSGLPLITEEEHEAITSTFSTLAEPEALNSWARSDSAPAPPHKNDLRNVYYVNVNLNTDTQPPQLKEQHVAVKANVDLSNQFFDVKADAGVTAKITYGGLADSQIARANYKAKAVNFLASSATWMADFVIKSQERKSKMDKNTFHDALVTAFTNGLNLPASITAQIEGILTNIKGTIVASDTYDDEGLLFFLIMTIYPKHDAPQAWQPHVRTVYFRVKQSLIREYTGSPIEVVVDIEYVQADGVFNESIFEANAKKSIDATMKEKSTSFIESNFDLAV